MSVRRFVKPAALALMATPLLGLGACTGEVVAPGTRIIAVTATVISGDGQVAEVGTRLPEPIVVRVDWVYDDGTTAPAAGQEVVAVDPCWEMGPDCDELHEEPPQTPWAVTDSAGEARIWWDLHTRAKQYTIRVGWANLLGPDCSPVCSSSVRADSVRVTRDTATAAAYPGPASFWAVGARLELPRVEGSDVYCSYTPFQGNCFPDAVRIQYGDVLIANVSYLDRYSNTVAPCDTVGVEWQLTDWPAWASERARVDGPRLYLTQRTSGGGDWIGGWTAVAAAAGAGCKDVEGKPARLDVYIKPFLPS